MPRNRLKKPAIPFAVPSDKDACALDINKIGALSREITVLQAAMNDEIAAITDKYTGQFSPLEAQVVNLQQGVQIFCEANRNELTQNGKTKTASFLTGEVQWRQRPPSVSARGVDAVIDALKSFGLHRFIRTEEKLNKDAILNEPAAVAGVAGLTIKKGVEDFVIKPFEIEEAA